MAAVRGVAEIVLAVHDLERAVSFYRDVLGLRPIPAPPEVKPVFLAAGADTAPIPQMLVLVPLPPDAPAFTPPRTLHHLALELAPEDFDAEARRLTDLGYVLRTGRHPVLPSRTMYVDDPEGNEVELICAAPA
ncbi:MAG TPA: VOC family protein [Chloroflexota bacterium]|nr:VOC family protein [Chloroflexota bacterium]